MLSKDEFSATVEYLGLSLGELAVLFDMDARSTRRWAEDPAVIPGPAEQALRAWVRLQRLGLAWRPDGVAIGERNTEKLAEEIKAHVRHAVDLDVLLRRVDARGGGAGQAEHPRVSEDPPRRHQGQLRLRSVAGGESIHP